MKRTVTAGLLAAVMLLGGCGGKPQPADPDVKRIDDLTDTRLVNLYGRNYTYEDGSAAFTNGASGFEVRFYGTTLTAEVSAFGAWDSMISVLTDGETDTNASVFTVLSGDPYAAVVLADLPEGEHTVRVLKRTDSYRSTFTCRSLQTDGRFLDAPARPALKLEFYGDSITNGSGVLRKPGYDEQTGKRIEVNDYTQDTQNAMQSYAGVCARELDAEYRIFGRGGIALKYSTDKNTVSSNFGSVAVDLPAAEYPYDYNSYRPDAVVIYLGTNDCNIALTHDTGYTPAGFEVAMIDFIRSVIGLYYGRNIPVFLCSGMFARFASLNSCMVNVKSRLAQEFPNIETVRFAACDIGHPVVEDNEVAGKQLAEAIKTKLGL